MYWETFQLTNLGTPTGLLLILEEKRPAFTISYTSRSESECE